ncbi:conserved hypothetical protein [Bacillus cereus Q1]|uniref:Uncharacterized protein n=1 Tax=Bacillus cereus (strain Q1) TaxID=361100 RepID=B9IZY8_BACCQ|nr:conserved hypothetical protein [Bacillus cereus Q1]
MKENDKKFEIEVTEDKRGFERGYYLDVRHDAKMRE